MKRKDIETYLRDLKDSTPCADCGNRYHFCMMDFDHVDETRKTFNLSSLPIQVSWDQVQEELEFCDIVCANCHRMRTWIRRVDKLGATGI